MLQKRLLWFGLISAVFISGYWFGQTTNGRAETANRVFEIRTYTANEGKLEALHARFRNHTTKLFERHGMTNIGYWSPKEGPLAQNTLIYILAYPNREAAKKSWEEFRNDPEWKKVQQESEANGRLVSNVDSKYLEPTDYSPMK